ncbi:MAG: hypothetical protein ACREMY_18915 [bacterium]
MNFLMRIELTDLTDVELIEVFDLIRSDVLHMKPGSPEWHMGMLSLDNIRYERHRRRALRLTCPRGPSGPGPGF